MAGESDIYDPTAELTISQGPNRPGDEAPSRVGDQWVKVEDETSEDYRTVLYRDGGGIGPRRVLVQEAREGGVHADQTNEDWPNHTNWLTDEAAKDEDRVRDPVPFEAALEAAVEYMEASGPKSTGASNPYDPTIEFDDPLLE